MFVAYFDYLLIFFAWGHFYFAYWYSFKKNGYGYFLHHAVTSFLLSFSLYSQLQAHPKIYIFLVIFAFLVHNTVDLFRFKKDNQGTFLFSSGLVFLVTFLLTNNPVSGLLIKFLVLYHYIFWYLLRSFSSKDKEKSFQREIIYVHLIFFITIFTLSFFPFQSFIQVVFSIKLFYFMTLHHVIFSYLSRYETIFNYKKKSTSDTSS